MDKKTGIIIGVWAACILVAVAIIFFAMRVPVYATVTDGEICGYDTETSTAPSNQYKECPNPKKLAHYDGSMSLNQTRLKEHGGSWLSFAGPPPCEDIKRELEQKVGEKVVWSNENVSTTTVKKGGKKYISYKCTAEARWNPIYVVERWEGCGLAPPVTTAFDVPKTCTDETRKLGTKWRWQ